jgi:heat shock protein HslJ
MKISLLFPIILLFLVNCDGAKSVSEKNDTKLSTSLGGNYIIVLINDRDLENKGLTMNFDKLTNNVSGNAGCNTYFGRFQQVDKSIIFNKVGATKKYCGDSEIMKIENQLLTLLPSIKLMDSNKSGNINFYNEQSKLLLSITNEKKI